jgi:hypothetical protein
MHHSANRRSLMIKTRILIGALAIAGLVGSPLAADARSHKHSKHPSTTTGANMKSEKGMAANPSSQGNVGPGTSNNNLPPKSGAK